MGKIPYNSIKHIILNQQRTGKNYYFFRPFSHGNISFRKSERHIHIFSLLHSSLVYQELGIVEMFGTKPLGQDFPSPKSESKTRCATSFAVRGHLQKACWWCWLVIVSKKKPSKKVMFLKKFKNSNLRHQYYFPALIPTHLARASLCCLRAFAWLLLLWPSALGSHVWPLLPLHFLVLPLLTSTTPCPSPPSSSSVSCCFSFFARIYSRLSSSPLCELHFFMIVHVPYSQ